MKTTKKLLSLIIAVMLIASTLVIGISADAAAPETWDGTVDTSWYNANSTTKTATLTTAEQLAGLSEISKTFNFLDWTIKLGSDIVLNTGNASDWGTSGPANEWTPISEFWGTFDGQGYVISGLYINQPTKVEVGFFSALNGGIVKNVSFVNSYVVGHHQVGTVAGIVKTVFGEINNVYSDAYVYAYPCNETVNDGAQAGGILGANAVALTTITGCWFDGEVYGVAEQDGKEGAAFYENDNKATQVGGIVGITNNTMEITDCLVTGGVYAHSQMGGIIGRVIQGQGSTVMTRCLMLGTVTSTRWAANSVFVGEFVGITMSGSTPTLKNCYGLSTYACTYTCTEMTSGHKSNATAVFGPHGGGGLTTDSTYDRFALADLTGDGATTKLTSYDFTDTWKTVADGTPVLKALETVATTKASGLEPIDPSTIDNTGGATSGDNTNNNTNNNTDNGSDNTTADTTADEETTAAADDTTAAVADDTTEAAAEEEGGCGSAITATAICTLAAAACGMAVVSRKKKEN